MPSNVCLTGSDIAGAIFQPPPAKLLDAVREGLGHLEIDPAHLTAALLALPSPRILDGGKGMSSAVPVLVFLTPYQPQIGFVN
jgi:hypothetical protein